jgi:hypothetical protein
MLPPSQQKKMSVSRGAKWLALLLLPGRVPTGTYSMNQRIQENSSTILVAGDETKTSCHKPSRTLIIQATSESEISCAVSVGAKATQTACIFFSDGTLWLHQLHDR